MTTRYTAAIALAVFAFAGEALACGDKFLIVGRGARYQRAYVAVHPSSLLVLDSNITSRKDIQAQLKRAGHRVSLAADADQVRQAVSSRTFDAVLADVADVPRVKQALSQVSRQPMLLPVVDGTSKEALVAAAAQYQCLLPSEGAPKSRRFLATLDAALDSKEKSLPIKCEVK